MFVSSESVHLGKELVERVFSLVVASAECVATAGTTDGVDFVDKDDARRLFFSLLEEVAHAAGADTYEHLDKVRTAQREERNLRLSGYGLGEEGLTGSRRPAQQHALWDFTTEVGVFFGVLQEVDDFEDFVFGSVEASNVFERGFHCAVGVKHLCTALADVENLSTRATCTATAHAAHKEEPQCSKQQNRNQPRKGFAPVVGFVFVLHADFSKLGVLCVKAFQSSVKRFRRHFKHVVRTLIGRVANRRFCQFLVLFDGR